jgi:hypothetical protein
VGRRLWHRMPWVAVGLAGAMASAGPLAGIEDQMATNLAGAYFIPGIAYLADAVGTQTETLAIRGFIRGRRDRPASPGARRAHRTARRLPFSRPQYCPSSAGNGTIPHDVDVNTQIEAAVGGQGSSSRP